MKNVFPILSMTALFSVISSAAMAQTSQPPQPTQSSQAGVEQNTLASAFGALGGDIFNSIIGLEKYIGDVYNTGMTWVIHENYQNIPNLNSTTDANTTSANIKITPLVLPSSEQGNTSTPQAKPIRTTPMQAAALNAQQETAANLQNSLMHIYYRFAGQQKETLTDIKTAEGTDFKTYDQDNTLGALTSNPITSSNDTNDPGTNASDTLYFKKLPSSMTSDSTPSVLIPKKINNSFLDFASFITPTAYTPTQQINAANFLKYAAQSTQNLAGDLNFTKITPQTLGTIKNEPTYQAYMFTIRSLLAIRSININALNQLKAERTPIPDLFEAAGGKVGGAGNLTQAEVSAKEASPLQVEAYQANHRFDNPQWYQSVENASPATVQRETLIVLAEIEHQNYEAHIDRERLLAATTAQNLLTNLQVMNTTLTLQESQLQKTINDDTK